MMKTMMSISNNDVKQENLCVAENLRILMDKSKIGISRLAEELGLPIMTIRRLLSGETTDPRMSTLKLLCDYFEVPISVFFETDGYKKYAKLPKKTVEYYLPILDWNLIKESEDICNIDFEQCKKWQPFYLKDDEMLNPKTFALESRPFMYPIFPLGTVFIIDPSVEPEDGDMLLVKIKSDNDLSFKKFAVDHPKRFLKSVISDKHILEYSKKDHIIIGVNIFTMLYKRKN
jgi:transcriptional regulator with XRE-family HTH domain